MCCTLIYLLIEDDQPRDDTCGADVMMKVIRRCPVDLVVRPYVPCSRSETYVDVGFVWSAHVATCADHQETGLTQVPAKRRVDTPRWSWEQSYWKAKMRTSTSTCADAPSSPRQSSAAAPDHTSGWQMTIHRDR